VKTFPTDHYRDMFRLRGLDYQSDSMKRPQYFGIVCIRGTGRILNCRSSTAGPPHLGE